MSDAPVTILPYTDDDEAPAGDAFVCTGEGDEPDE